ncbi:winged helix-turn-helix domain-containing protein [Komagataeibacter rhaeticus]|nr:winged helix-turn-helix domain-containing protein [Komagataeibacter rhaeticus]
MATPVISVLPSGFLGLGHLTPFGIQTSIENFDDFDHVQRWAKGMRLKPKYEIGGKLIGNTDLLILSKVSGLSVGQIAFDIGMSVTTVTKSIDLLCSAGLASVEWERPKKSCVPSITDAGLAALSTFSVRESEATP